MGIDRVSNTGYLDSNIVVEYQFEWKQDASTKQGEVIRQEKTGETTGFDDMFLDFLEFYNSSLWRIDNAFKKALQKH